MAKVKYLIPKIAVFLIVLVLIIIISTKPTGWRYNEDDLSTVSPAIINYQTGRWIFYDEFNEKTGTYGFMPPGYIISENGLLFPKGFLGLKLEFMLFYSVLGDDLAINLWQGLLYLLCVFVSYAILRKFLPLAKALAGSMLFGISPFLLTNLSSFYQEITVLFLLFSSILMFLRYDSTKNKIYIYLFITFYFVSVLFKFNYIVLAPIFLSIFLFVVKENKPLISKFFLKKVLILAVLFFIIYSPQLVYNYQTMGNPLSYYFTSYQNVYSGQIFSTTEEQNDRLQKVDNLFLYRGFHEYLTPNKNAEGSYFYVQNLVATPFLLFLLFPLIFFFLFFYKINKKYFIFIILLFILNFLIFANLLGGFGLGNVNLRSSYSRYMFFPFSLMILGSIIALFYYTKKRTLYTFIFIIILLMSHVFINEYPFGLYVFGDIKNQYTYFSKSIELNTEPNSVVFDIGFDNGFLLGRRKTYNYGYIPINNSYEIIKTYNYLKAESIPSYVFYYNGSTDWIKDSIFNFEDCFYLETVDTYNKYYILSEIKDINEPLCEKNYPVNYEN